jgi:hypothetical protein
MKMMFQQLLQRYEPRETLPVWALCRQAELSHVAGPDVGRTAPPPMVANMLHCINPLLKKEITINTQSDLEAAQRRPSWIRAVGIETYDDPRGFATSKSLKKLNLNGTTVTDAGLTGIQCIPTLEDLSLYHCQQVTSVTRLATSQCQLREIAIPALECIGSALSSRRRSC